MDAIEIDADVWAPRTEEQRYRIYERDDRRGGLVLLATAPSPEAVGVAIVEQALDRMRAVEEGLLSHYEVPVIGVLDGIEGRWISGVWLGGVR